jgi:DNA-binding MarR family transcriptional regulator
MNITQEEAKVLRVLGEDEGASVYELATGASLTASEVRNAISHLVEHHLAETVRNTPGFIRLTNEGKRLRRSLSPGRDVPKGLVVTDELPWFDANLSEADLDAALDAAVQQESAGVGKEPGR